MFIFSPLCKHRIAFTHCGKFPDPSLNVLSTSVLCQCEISSAINTTSSTFEISNISPEICPTSPNAPIFHGNIINTTFEMGIAGIPIPTPLAPARTRRLWPLTTVDLRRRQITGGNFLGGRVGRRNHGSIGIHMF